MRLAIHIGQFKTGSTAIQGWLQINYQKLIGHGIFLPRPEVNNHNYIVSALQPENMSTKRFRIGDQTSYELFDEAFQDARKAKCHTVVISSEYLSNSSSAVVAELSETLARFDVSIDVIYLIRPIAEQIASSVSQQIRSRNFDRDKIAKKVIRHDRILARWDKYFENVHVASIKNRSAIEIVASLLGVGDADFEPPKRVNSAIDSTFISILASLQGSALSDELYGSLVRYANSQKVKQKFLISRDDCKQIEEQHRDIIDNVLAGHKETNKEDFYSSGVYDSDIGSWESLLPQELGDALGCLISDIFIMQKKKELERLVRLKQEVGFRSRTAIPDQIFKRALASLKDFNRADIQKMSERFEKLWSETG